MLRFLAILTTFVGSFLAITPTHLKPGALTDKLGKIFLVKEVLTVRYPYSPLTNTTSIIKIVQKH